MKYSKWNMPRHVVDDTERAFLRGTHEVFVIWTAVTALRTYRGRPEFTRPAVFAIFMVLVQFTLGALTVLHVKAPTMTTLHVSGGAATLGIMVLLGIRARHLLLPRTASEMSPRMAVSEA